MNFLNTLSGCELVSLAAILSVSLSNGLSTQDINTLGDFFSSLGQNLSTIANAQESNTSSSSISNFGSCCSSNTNC